MIGNRGGFVLGARTIFVLDIFQFWGGPFLHTWHLPLHVNARIIEGGILVELDGT